MPSAGVSHPPAQTRKPVLWTRSPQETNAHHALNTVRVTQLVTHKLMCREFTKLGSQAHVCLHTHSFETAPSGGTGGLIDQWFLHKLFTQVPCLHLTKLCLK